MIGPKVRHSVKSGWVELLEAIYSKYTILTYKSYCPTAHNQKYSIKTFYATRNHPNADKTQKFRNTLALTQNQSNGIKIKTTYRDVSNHK